MPINRYMEFQDIYRRLTADVIFLYISKINAKSPPLRTGRGRLSISQIEPFCNHMALVCVLCLCMSVSKLYDGYNPPATLCLTNVN